ncbi:hypothetical protein [Deinococcus marmoris]|uniref:Uncharacterized protein n=1 Tax=Deinococcus marmoris TaxID=249408 RepID=A0A1U7P2Y2_9DEIO|nr:hypothetical protein [Deinococcus marmoris]OLV19532.1 hypothetical protein BOO71_0002335 [Deinococcus marmoris]
MKRLDKLIQAVQMLSETLPAEAATLALAAAVAGADLNIYNTVPGRGYVRTGQTRRSIRIQRWGKDWLLIAGYGAYKVEFGSPPAWDWVTINADFKAGAVSGVPGMSNLRQSTVSIGRSGLNWRVPGPFIAPAALAATFHMHRRFREELKKL